MMPWRDAPTNTEERKPWAAGLIDPALCKFDGVEAAFEALWHDRKPHQLPWGLPVTGEPQEDTRPRGH
jgi:hypothetical protein